MYSENGGAPIGERKVTHYSTDPHELEELLDKEPTKTPAEIREKLFERQNSRKGVNSVTMIEKFGEDIDDEKRFLDNRSYRSNESSERELRHSPSRNSIDALKQKFSSLESSSNVTETTTSHYPKAGLILRSQRSSRSSTPISGGFRSGSVDFEESDVEVRALTRKTSREKISSSRQHISNDPFEDEVLTAVNGGRSRNTTNANNSTQSFLDSESQVVDIQDLLNRMKNADKGGCGGYLLLPSSFFPFNSFIPLLNLESLSFPHFLHLPLSFFFVCIVIWLCTSAYILVRLSIPSFTIHNLPCILTS